MVFEIIGLVLIWLGLAAAGVGRDPFTRRPADRVVPLGWSARSSRSS